MGFNSVYSQLLLGRKFCPTHFTHYPINSLIVSYCMNFKYILSVVSFSTDVALMEPFHNMLAFNVS